MPRIITSAEQFEQIKPLALEARVVRSGQKVKLKIRTPSYLYTYVTDPDEAQDMIKGLKNIEVIEYSRGPAKEEKESDGKKKKQKQQPQDDKKSESES